MKKKLFITLLVILAIVTGIFVFTACNDQNDNGNDDTTIIDPDTPLDPGACEHANVQHQNAKSVSCTANGNLEYWYCPSCQKYFSDSEFKNETSLSAVTIVSQGHAYGEWIAEIPSDCAENKTGVAGHYHCSNLGCGKNFDANKNELSSLVIPATHEYGEWEPEHPAVDCQHVGTVGYYYCEKCQQHFDATHNIIPEPLVSVRGPHSLTHVPAVTEAEADCGEEYYDEYWHCTVDGCGADFADAQGNELLDFIIAETKQHNYVYNYNYTTHAYDGVCSHNSNHTDTIEAGTEAYPYLVQTDIQLNTALAKGGYVKLVDNITVTIAQGVAIQKAVILDLNGKIIETTYVPTTAPEKTTTSKALWGYNTTCNAIVKNGTIVNNATPITNFTPVAVYVSGGATLTLQNVNVESSYYGVYVAKSSEVNINGGTISAVKVGVNVASGTESAKAVVSIDGTTINVTERGVQLRKYAQGTLNNCNITTVYNANINVASDGIDIWSNATLNMTNGSISSHRYGIVGNGTDTTTSITLTDVEISSYMGIYHPQKSSTMTINGGSITGSGTAIEVRSGIVNINASKSGNAVLTSTSKNLLTVANGNGTTTEGMALTVSQHTTNEKIVVTLNGATLNGLYALYEQDLMDETTPKDITIILEEGNTLNGCVYSENCKNIVNDRIASTEAELVAYLAEAGRIELANDIVVTEKTFCDMRQNNVIDLGGHKLSGNIAFNVYDGADVTLKNGDVEIVWFSITDSEGQTVKAGQYFTVYGGKLAIEEVNVTEKTVKSGTGCVAIFGKATVNIKKSTIVTNNWYTLSTNASNDIDPTVNIEDSIMFCKLSTSILFNVGGTLNATNSKFYAINQAVILRAGTANFEGCTLSNNVTAIDADGNVTDSLKEVTVATTTYTASGITYVGGFNGYYDSEWSQGNIKIPLNALVVGSKNGSYAPSAVCNLVDTTVIDGFVGVLAETGKAEDFTHYAIYAINDTSIEGSVATVNYDQATAEKSGLTNTNVRADRDATIALVEA